ncbi:TIGR02642 family protein [Vibrio sp. TBV020]|uniref:TIGR02642 family protein n=1 Tax=Vibrio sp. TBV020 TaxID=3137398 RepID=UPI0038CD6A20
MSNVVELLEKLSKPKSVNMSSNFNRSKNSLDKQELYSAICVAGNKNPIGLSVVMATEFGEVQHVEKLQCHLLEAFGSDKNAQALMTVAYAELCFLPLGKNQTRIKSLFKRHGARANRSRRMIDSWKRAIKSLSKTGRHEGMIEQHELDIKTEKQALDDYADKYSRLSCHCPRCGGTGNGAEGPCKSCNGDGYFKNNHNDWKIHLSNLNVKLDNDAAIKIESVVSELNANKALAIQAMKARAKRERAD